jgi:hypothetical protein
MQVQHDALNHNQLIHDPTEGHSTVERHLHGPTKLHNTGDVPAPCEQYHQAQVLPKIEKMLSTRNISNMMLKKISGL